MEKSTVKIIVCVVIFLIFGGLSALAMLVDLNLVITETSSIEGVIAKREKLIELEGKLNEAELEYTNKKNDLVTAKAEFEKAKNKYEAISDKTVELIREATTEENYDIEYMWIKLGNYAMVNNLSIIMVEPGGTSTTIKQTQSTDQNGNKTANSNSSTTTNTTTTANANNSANSSSTTKNDNDVNFDESNSESTTSNTQDSILTVTVEGSYLNMADFVFEVENDKELRFKLDNIEITCVTGTTIKAKFNVKNVIVLK